MNTEQFLKALFAPIIYTALVILADMVLSPILPEYIPSAAPAALLGAAAALPFFTWMYRNDHRSIEDREYDPHSMKKVEPARLTMYESAEKDKRCHAKAVGICVLLAAVGAAYSAGTSYLMHQLGVYAFFSNETQEAMFKAPLWILVAGPGLLVPAAEEVCYRGLCYGQLRNVLRPVPAALIAAGLFALGHGNMIQMIYALPSALILTFLYEKGLRAGIEADLPRALPICYPIAFHIGANMLSIILY